MRRAVSTTYYALFHALAKDCADRLIGTSQARSQGAWRQVYRALEHGFAKNAGAQAEALGFPDSIVDFADTFTGLQEERHTADYNPDSRYTLADARTLISRADQDITDLRGTSNRDLAAFAALVLLKRRSP